MGAANASYAPSHVVSERVAIGGAGLAPDSAPSIQAFGSGLQDHRYVYNARGYGTTLPGVLGWYGGDTPMVVDAVPSTAASANIAALANVTSGTAMTLRAATGAGITVLAAAQSFFPNPIVGGVQNVVPVGACVIDGVPAPLLFGGTGPGVFTTGFYDPSTMLARCISITGVSSGTGGAFLVRGFDVYGFPMSQTITVGAGVNTVNSTKAFKAVVSVTPQFSDAHNYSVGTADLFGFNLLTKRYSHIDMLWNETWTNSATTFVAADTTNPATNLTGDVRGTIGVPNASDGTKRLVMFITPSITDLQANLTTGLFGQPQV